MLPVLGAGPVRSTGLDAQQLLAIVPLVERLGFVQSFVALQANEPRPYAVGDGLGERGLAGATSTGLANRSARKVTEAMASSLK